MKTLPPGLTQRQFSDALKEFSLAVGKEWIFTSEEDLNTYRDDYSPIRGQREEPLASAVVGPDSVEKVQKVVKIANQYSIPLWVISCGKNWGYGGPGPGFSGCVVVDMKRMNRILEVNEDFAYALVEPGVNFFDLYRYIREKGLKLWFDGPVAAWGSVIANALERGLGQGLTGDLWNFQCGMEVILPNGELMRTGMGAIPGSQTWQQYKWGFGPHIDGLFSQTNLGIVTKMGTWLMPEPQSFLACQIKVPHHEDIIPMIDILRPLRQSGLLPNAAIFPLPRTPSSDLNQPVGWLVRVGLYGLEKVTDIHWAYVQEKYSAIRGVEFESKRYTAPYDPEKMDSLAKLLAGIPSVVSYGYSNAFFSPIIPFSGDVIWKLIGLFDNIYKEYGRRFFGDAIHVHHPHALVAPAPCAVSRTDPKVNQETVEIMKKLIAEAAKQGWGAYRITTTFMDDAMNAFDYNNRSLLRLHETLKDALDPSGILAPGKNGIWPKHMRERKS